MGVPVIKMSSRTYQICECCVMDTTDEDIVFDENGVCERCNEYKTRIEPEWNHGKGHEDELKALIMDIKRKGGGVKNMIVSLGLAVA